MSLKVARFSLIVLNALATLAAIATIVAVWNDDRTLAGLAIAAVIAATVLGAITPLFYMVGIVAGPGLGVYALTGSWLAGLMTSAAVTAAFYLLSWQLRKHGRKPG
jgi:hypothetical protein